MASSADDLVAYYSASLQGAFFANPATLTQFREILAMGGAIWLVPLPLGVSAFAKGGSIDVPGFHAVCVAGGMFFDDRWVYLLPDHQLVRASGNRHRYGQRLPRRGQPRAHPGQGRAVLTRAPATVASSASTRTRPRTPASTKPGANDPEQPEDNQCGQDPPRSFSQLKKASGRGRRGEAPARA